MVCYEKVYVTITHSQMAQIIQHKPYSFLFFTTVPLKFPSRLHTMANSFLAATIFLSL